MMERKSEKITRIVYVIAVVAAIAITVIYHLPELKKIKGSSDNIIDIDNYETIVGVTIDSGPEFLLVSGNKKITNILFLNPKSIVLYNKDIENNNIRTAINKIISILEKKNYLQSGEITLTLYPDSKDYVEIKSAFNEKLIINEQPGNYQEKTKALGFEVTTDNETQIRNLEEYSYKIVREYKNKKIQDGITNRMTEEESIAAANRVYEKLSTYAIDVENQETNSTALPIEKVPANQDLTIYPSSESWYYIKNHKVYAYINFTGLTDDYEFCYNGSIEKMKRGKCS